MCIRSTYRLLAVSLCSLFLIFFVSPVPAQVLPSSPEVDRGIRLLNEKNLDEALKVFEASSAANPQDPIPRYFSGVVYHLKGDRASALRFLQEALALRPDLIPALYESGLVLEETGRLAEAREIYWRVIEADAVRIGRGEEGTTEGRSAEARIRSVAGKELFYLAGGYFQKKQFEEALPILTAARALEPKDPRIAAALGRVYRQMRMSLEAIEAFQAALAEKRDDVPLLMELAAAQEAASQFEEAMKTYRRVTELAPGSPESEVAGKRFSAVEKGIKIQTHFDKMGTLMKEERWKEAEGEIREVLNLEPDNPSALFNLGRVYHQLDQSENAVDPLKKAVSLSPKILSAQLELAMVYEALGRYDEALSGYEKVIASPLQGWDAEKERARKQLEDLRKAIGTKKQVGAIEALIEKSDIEGAVREAEELIRLQPNNPKVYWALGSLYLRVGRSEEAVSILEKARDLFPKETDILTLLAQTYAQVGRLEAAATAYRRLESLQKGTPMGKTAADLAKSVTLRSHFEKSKEMMDRGDFEGALGEVRQILEIFPEDPVALFNAGVLYDRLDRTPEAKASLERALQISPDYSSVHLQLALILERTGDLEGALEEYRRVVALAPGEKEGDYAAQRLKSAESMGEIRESLQEFSRRLSAGDLKGAREMVNRMVTLSPDSPIAHYQLGIVEFREGRNDEALSALKRALELNPKFADAYLQSGFIYEEQGYYEEAREMYRKASSEGKGQRAGDVAGIRLRFLRPWQGGVVIGHNYDTNINLGSSAQGSLATNYALNLAYQPLQSRTRRFSLGVDAGRSIFYSSAFTSESFGWGGDAGWTLHETLALSGSYNDSMVFVKGEKKGDTHAYALGVASRGDEIPTSLSLSFKRTRSRSLGNPAADTDQIVAGLSMTHSLTPRDSLDAGYSFAVNRNLDILGSNYANRTQGVALTYARRFGRVSQASVGYSVNRIRYSNPDSTTLFHQFRANLSQNVAIRFNTKISDQVSLQISSSYTDNRTNLPAPTAEARQTLEDLLTTPIPAVGGGYQKLLFGAVFSVTF